MKRTIAAAVAAFLPVSAFAAQTDAVILWNANAGVAATKACIAPLDDPFHESRIYAMMHLAIHDAVNAIERKFQPYAYDKQAPGASPDAAVAAAAHDVLVPLITNLPDLVKQTCIEAGVASVEAAYKDALAAIPDNPAKTQGIELGQASAAATLVKRAKDHAEGQFVNKTCPEGKPGSYRCTPGFPFVAFEIWADVTPFVLEDGSQFRPGAPFDITDKRFQADLDEVKTWGGDGTTTTSKRTPDQTEIALFWMESSPLKWSRIARTVAAEKKLDTWENARLFAVLNMALADGYIAMSSAKNHYDFWRPVTAIQISDPSWTPLKPTPPNQDYPSGHSIEGGAGAEVLKQVFGDQVNFQDCGATLPADSTCYDPKPKLRSFTSFTQAAEENADSRVLIGFHFRNSTVEGTAYGRKIGERAVTLLPAVK